MCRISCTLEGLYKKEATWVAASDITLAAIQYHKLLLFWPTIQIIFRSYEKPDPPLRCTISELVSTIQHSLQAGIIRQYTEFPRHVLFDNKGSTVPNRPEKLYDRADFISPYFLDDNFVYYNKHGEGFKVHSQKYTDCIGSVQILYRSRKYRPILDFWAII